jgi:hypothetical protein
MVAVFVGVVTAALPQLRDSFVARRLRDESATHVRGNQRKRAMRRR